MKKCPACRKAFDENEYSHHLITCQTLAFALDPDFDLPGRRIDGVRKIVNVRRMKPAEYKHYRHTRYIERKKKAQAG